MLPEKRKSSDEDGGGGFEVRVIGGGRALPAGAVEGGLEIGLRIGAGERNGRVPDACDPVSRLEVANREEPLPARSMSEVGPAEPMVPRGGRKRRRGLAHWTAWMAAATGVLVVAAVAGLLLSGKSKATKTSNAPGYGVEKRQPIDRVEKRQPIDREQAYFLANSGELIAQAEALLERYAAAATVEQALPLVRDAEQVKERMEKLWQPWGVGAPFAADGEIAGFIIEDSGRPGISLAGRKGDFSRFQMVFVREGEQLKLDWEASYGIGEVQIAELREGAPVAGRKVRAVVRPANFHPAEFPEDRYGSYQLADAEGEHFVWAFAPVGSAVAAEFEAEFNEGSVLLEQSAEIQATVRLAGSATTGGNCYQLTEMLHKGWVTP